MILAESNHVNHAAKPNPYLTYLKSLHTYIEGKIVVHTFISKNIEWDKVEYIFDIKSSTFTSLKRVDREEIGKLFWTKFYILLEYELYKSRVIKANKGLNIKEISASLLSAQTMLQNEKKLYDRNDILDSIWRMASFKNNRLVICGYENKLAEQHCLNEFNEMSLYRRLLDIKKHEVLTENALTDMYNISIERKRDFWQLISDRDILINNKKELVVLIKNLLSSYIDTINNISYFKDTYLIGSGPNNLYITTCKFLLFKSLYKALLDIEEKSQSQTYLTRLKEISDEVCKRYSLGTLSRSKEENYIIYVTKKH